MIIEASMTPLDDTSRIKKLFDDGDVISGRIELKKFLNTEISISNAQWALQFKENISSTFPLKKFRLAYLRSYTIEPLMPILQAMALIYDMDLQIWAGEFNSYAQELIDPNSPLYNQNFDAVYLGVLSRDICPGLWEGHFTLNDDEGQNELEKAQDLITLLLGNFRRISKKPMIIQGFEPMPYAYRANSASEINSAAFSSLNNCLKTVTREIKSAYVTDYAALIAAHGHNSWFDEKKWRLARQNINASHLPDFAESLMHYFVPLSQAPAKVIVSDLDHTMWHGVIGEDGLEGIKISDKGKNGGHLQYQKLLKQLKNEGFLLAVSSKNNQDDAMRAIDNHPDMVLRSDDFALIKANWDTKAQAIQEIAEELNLGLESIVFIDDNPVEREAVARTLPQVSVVELPQDTQGYALAVSKCARLSRLLVSNEDNNKTQQYAAEAVRKKAMQNAGDMSSFLRDLNMKVLITSVSNETLERAAQLTQKTNQFNVTTFRYQESDIQSMLEKTSEFRTYIGKASDRFGDHGWIILALIEIKGDHAVFDTLLMSCRVLGRGVEAAFIAHIAKDLKSVGIKFLHGAILPTKKNEPAREVFEKHGFSQKDTLPFSEEQGKYKYKGTTYWTLNLNAEKLPKLPEWIELQT